ncbi:hypothetical protein [Eilatimonas milleporae]|uniref:Uncharacterized protein n=1 Tax=Eilatimonas milleporae TaxID=911205 RepID=A0A3M0CXR7_9PROT|nr:hypothetical protein [Eilatimonas milleporae]RMB12439.1 hypothetical protein BXY39_0935 [Eilatimonas milleporae]
MRTETVAVKSVAPHLLRQIPDDSGTVLVFGAPQGLARAVKLSGRARTVICACPAGTGGMPHGDAVPDRIIELDLENPGLHMPAMAADCVLFDHALEAVSDPVALLRAATEALAPNDRARILAVIANMQHFQRLKALLRGDYQLGDWGSGPVGEKHPFAYSNVYKTFLDAGLWVDRFDRHIPDMCDDDLWQGLAAGVGAARGEAPYMQRHILARDFIVSAGPIAWLKDVGTHRRGLTFAVATNDPMQLKANFRQSPLFRAHTDRFETLVYERAQNAPQVIADAVARARHDIVVWVHQDVYLPHFWADRFLDQWQDAERQFGPIGVAGIFGARRKNGDRDLVGSVVDRFLAGTHGGPLPARVDTLDEIVLAFNKNRPLQLDPALGWHFYGSDAGFKAARDGRAAVVLEAPAYHNSLTGKTLPDAYFDSMRHLCALYPDELPIAASTRLVTGAA